MNATNHQPLRVPMYEKPYYEIDICFITNQIEGFQTNGQGPKQDY